jgi:hypothetical protein
VDRRSFEAGPPETALLSDRMRRDHLDLVYEDPAALVFAVRPHDNSTYSLTDPEP